MTVGRRNERWKLKGSGAAFAIGSALETGVMVVLWFLLGAFSHDVPSGDHRRSPRGVIGKVLTMTIGRRNERWKLMAIGVAFAIGSALETGLVVAQWTGRYSDQKMVEIGQVCAALDSGGSQTGEGACSALPSTRP